MFLAGFAAGVTVATLSPTVNRAFGPLGEQLSELFKLGALLVFGALISPAFLGSIGPAGYLFALAALVLARPAALAAALVGSGLPWREQVAAAWFGPKGFASVLYAIMVLEARSASGDHVFHLAALVVTASIVAHSSTDVLVARWLDRGTVSEDQRGRRPSATTRRRPLPDERRQRRRTLRRGVSHELPGFGRGHDLEPLVEAGECEGAAHGRRRVDQRDGPVLFQGLARAHQDAEPRESMNVTFPRSTIKPSRVPSSRTDRRSQISSRVARSITPPSATIGMLPVSTTTNDEPCSTFRPPTTGCTTRLEDAIGSGMAAPCFGSKPW